MDSQLHNQVKKNKGRKSLIRDLVQSDIAYD